MKPTVPLRNKFGVFATTPAVAQLCLVRPMKRAIILPVLTAALLLIGCSRASMTEPKARHVSEDAFTRTCRSFDLSASDYRGPSARQWAARRLRTSGYTERKLITVC